MSGVNRTIYLNPDRDAEIGRLCEMTKRSRNAITMELIDRGLLVLKAELHGEQEKTEDLDYLKREGLL